MSLEQAIEKNTAAIVALTAAIAQAGIATQTLPQAEQEKAAEPPKAEGPTKAQEKAAAQKKAKADADAAIKKVAGKDKEPTAAQKAKADRDAKRQAEIDAETAEASSTEAGEPEAADVTLEDCRVVATYIMKVKKDKAGLSGTLKGMNTKNISGFQGDPADFLAALEDTAGKTLAEIKG